MRKLFLVLVILVMGVFAGKVGAQEKVEVMVSSDEVEVGEAFELMVGVDQVGAGQVNISGVKVPGVEDFEVRGTSTQTQVRVVNGQSAAATTVRYTLVAREEGTFVLGPVEVDGGESNQVEVIVDGVSSAPIVGGVVAGDESESDGERGWLVMGVLGLIVVGGVVAVGKMMSRRSGADVVGDPSTAKHPTDALRASHFAKASRDRQDDPAERGRQITSTEKDYSASEIRSMTVEWLEERVGEELRQMSTSEIARAVGKDGKMGQAVGVLELCDKAIYAKEEIAGEELLKEFTKL